MEYHHFFGSPGLTCLSNSLVHRGLGKGRPRALCGHTGPRVTGPQKHGWCCWVYVRLFVFLGGGRLCVICPTAPSPVLCWVGMELPVWLGFLWLFLPLYRQDAAEQVDPRALLAGEGYSHQVRRGAVWLLGTRSCRNCFLYFKHSY